MKPVNRKCDTCKFEYRMSEWETGCNRKEKYKNPCSFTHYYQHWEMSKDELWKTMKAEH